MMLVISGGKVVDPATSEVKERDLIIKQSRIIAPEEATHTQNIKVIDARGMLVFPGFVDLRAHLGEPGFEDRETMQSALAAAAKGGFTVVATNPATFPVCDSRSVCEFVRKRAEEVGGPEVVPTGTLSADMKGEMLSHIGELAECGCKLIGDPDFAVDSSELMRRALEYTQNFDVRVATYPLDRLLWGRGVLREGVVSTRLGLPGTPTVAETAPLYRDLSLASYTGGKLHVARLSTKEGVDLLKFFRQRYGADATADTTPFHLFFTDEDLVRFDSAYKFLPPLGSNEDLRALRRAVRDGIINVVCSDHMPRNLVDKELELDQAEPGATSLETTASALFTLAAEGWISYLRIAQVLSLNPAQILGLNGRGSLAPGNVADVVLVDPEFEWEVNPSEFESRCKITPFAGKKLVGRVVLTIARGRIVYDGRKENA